MYMFSSGQEMGLESAHCGLFVFVKAPRKCFFSTLPCQDRVTGHHGTTCVTFCRGWVGVRDGGGKKVNPV